MSYSDFTSMPPEQEREFVVFEEATRNNEKKATSMGLIVGGVFGLFMVIIAVVIDTPKNAHAVDSHQEVGAEAVPSAKRAAPAPKAAPVAAEPAAEAADSAGSEAAEVQAPKPVKGTTKAPPAALIGQ